MISPKYYGISIDIAVFLMYNISKANQNLLEETYEKKNYILPELPLDKFYRIFIPYLLWLDFS